MKNLEKLTAYELALRHAHLMAELEQLPPGTQISLEKKKELAALEKDLQRRLHSLLIGDIPPVIPAVIIVFNFDVISELKTLIDRFEIEAPTKKEAWEKAREKAETYPGLVSLEII